MFNIPQTPYDLCFRFWGFPIRVHPFFWLIIALLGSSGGIGDMRIWLVELATWIAAAFTAILVHELGHALVFRHVFGVNSMIVFYGLGGLTIPTMPHRRKPGLYGTLCEVLLSFAGPLAGFLLAALLTVVFLAMNSVSFDRPESILEATNVSVLNARTLLSLFLLQLIAVSILWGVFNLLPIHPMDGGQIAREIFCYFSPRRGVAHSLVLSIVVAVSVGVFAFSRGGWFIALLFAYFAYNNYLELSSRSFRYR